MEFITEVFGYISGLGKYLMIPLMIVLIGIIAGCKVSKALRAGITVGVALMGISQIMAINFAYISPISNALVEKFGLNLEVVDVGWATISSLAYSTTVGTLIIPFILVVNIILLAVKATRTIDIDIWNYWHWAFVGSLVAILTDSILYGFLAAALSCTLSLVLADRTAKDIEDVMGLSGVSIPQAATTPQVIQGKLLDKLFDIIEKPFKKNKEDNSDEVVKKVTNNKILLILKDPAFLGMILGSLLGFVVGYDVGPALTTGIAMAALMLLLPRMVKVLMEGMLPINEAAKSFMKKKFRGAEFHIGMDSAVMVGHPTALAVGMLLVPINLILAMILPGNKLLPMADLAAMVYLPSMLTVMHKGKFGRVLISGTIFSAIGLLAGTYFAPMVTEFAVASGTMPEGVNSISAISAGNPVALVINELFRNPTIGVVVSIVLIVGLALWNRRKITKEEAANAVAVNE